MAEGGAQPIRTAVDVTVTVAGDGAVVMRDNASWRVTRYHPSAARRLAYDIIAAADEAERRQK